jgi:hypothetical protein
MITLLSPRRIAHHAYAAQQKNSRNMLFPHRKFTLTMKNSSLDTDLFLLISMANLNAFAG